MSWGWERCGEWPGVDDDDDDDDKDNDKDKGDDACACVAVCVCDSAVGEAITALFAIICCAVAAPMWSDGDDVNDVICCVVVPT